MPIWICSAKRSQNEYELFDCLARNPNEFDFFEVEMVQVLLVLLHAWATARTCLSFFWLAHCLGCTLPTFRLCLTIGETLDFAEMQ